jgi:hypothetical protein
VGSGSEKSFLKGDMAPRHTPDYAAEESPAPLPTPNYDPFELLKAALNVFAAEVQTLDGPRDLTEETTAQTGFYTHRGLDEQASSIRPGALTPDTPPRSRPQEHGWTRGSAWEDERKIF